VRPWMRRVRLGAVSVLSVMTWNLENLERPKADAESKEGYARRLGRIVEVIAEAGSDLVGVQEVLASRQNLAPEVFDDLRSELSTVTGQPWNGCLSQLPDARGIRVGWLSPGQSSDPTDIALYPRRCRPRRWTTRARRSLLPSAAPWASPTPAPMD
jgi:hypothetical protein